MENGEKMLEGHDRTKSDGSRVRSERLKVDPDNIVVDESGYSEEKIDRDIELQAGQWLDLNSSHKTKPAKQVAKTVQNSSQSQRQVPQSTSQARILFSHQQDIWEKLTNRVTLFRQELERNKDVTELLQEIQQLQATHGSLLKALKWAHKGELDVTKLPKEVQNLLK